MTVKHVYWQLSFSILFMLWLQPFNSVFIFKPNHHNMEIYNHNNKDAAVCAPPFSSTPPGGEHGCMNLYRVLWILSVLSVFSEQKSSQSQNKQFVYNITQLDSDAPYNSHTRVWIHSKHLTNFILTFILWYLLFSSSLHQWEHFLIQLFFCSNQTPWESKCESESWWSDSIETWRL